jgi:hypothetical protein
MASMISTGFPTYRTNQIQIRDEMIGVFANANDDNLEDLEVDYDNNVTDLYRFIANSQWQEALQAVRRNPIEAKTWVVRYHEDEDKGMMWRFLPIHSASARQPPEALMNALIQAYPEGAECCDDQGKYALHYAAGNQASSGVILALLDAFPSAATTSDPEGKLPLHWIAISGPFEPNAIEPLVYGSKTLYNIVDDEGWTPLAYAQGGDYPYKDLMVEILTRHNSPPKRMALSSIPTDLSYTQSKHHESPYSTSGLSCLSPSSASANFSLYQGSRSANTPAAKGSTNKTLSKFKAQVVKLKAEAAFKEAEYEEKIASNIEEHDDALAELEATINQELEKMHKAKQSIASKDQFIAYKEGRVVACDKDLSHYNDHNDRLQNEIDALNEDFRAAKNLMGEYKLRTVSLKAKMNDLAKNQLNISQSLESIEADAKAANEARRQKLQALFDDELKDVREMAELKRVYGNMIGGPTIKEALSQQKNLMKNCEIVLEECDIDGSP